MPRATLFVHSFSFPYIENFVRYFHGILRRQVDPDAQLLIADEVDSEAYEEGLVFVIGENLAAFRRRPNCRYIFLNLSVVTLLGSPFAASLNGCLQVFRKRRMLLSKLHLFDALLDYYPPQTAALKRQLSIPVYGFDVAVPARATVPIADRDYDVCFVGGITARRGKLLDGLEQEDIVMSPHSGASIEKIAERSRCCLNVHQERSNHLEIPRVLAAVSAGCPVVTENSYGLEALGMGSFVKPYGYTELVHGIRDMLSDKQRLQERADAARDWYSNHYLPAAETRWAALLAELGGGVQVTRQAG